MDPFVQSLHSRLEESNRQAMRMFETFIDRSLDEMEAKGYFSDLDPSRPKWIRKISMRV